MHVLVERFAVRIEMAGTLVVDGAMVGLLPPHAATTPTNPPTNSAWTIRDGHINGWFGGSGFSRVKYARTL
jgi:hypothetical protein